MNFFRLVPRLPVVNRGKAFAEKLALLGGAICALLVPAVGAQATAPATTLAKLDVAGLAAHREDGNFLSEPRNDTLDGQSRGEPWVYRFHAPDEHLNRKFLTYAQNVQGGALGKWSSNVINWRYNDANRPAGLVPSSAAALTLLNNAMNQWSAVCNVSFNYQGTSTNGPSLALSPQTFDSVNVVGWGPLSSPTTGITGVGGNGTSLSEGDIVLNNQFNPDLASTILHEVGHFLGLRHSDVSNTLMAGPPLTQYSGVSGLQADDIAGCVSLFGAPGGGIAGVATFSSGGAVPNGTALCANPSAGVSCTTTNNGSYSCTMPTGWTGTLHLQAGNANRVAAVRYVGGVVTQNTPNFVVYPNGAFTCNLDVDNNGINDPASDGVMIMRKLFGNTGVAQLTTPSTVCAQRTNQTEMLNYLNARNYNFNSGGLSSQQEGLLLLKLMLGIPGAQAVGGTGQSWASVQAFVNSSCGTNFQ